MANIADFAAKCRSREPGDLSNIDEEAKAAFTADARDYLGAVISGLVPQGRKGRRGLRKRHFLSCMGSVSFVFQYVPKGSQVADTFKALGWERMVSASAKRHITRAGALSGSFAEARDTLIDLASADVSATRVRSITLEVGKGTLAAQENGTLQDIGGSRTPPTQRRRRKRGKDGSPVIVGTYVGETMVISADGTGAPCTHADTDGVDGKDGEEAGTRELKVALVAVYTHVDEKGRPMTNRACTSYMVTYRTAAELIPALRREAIRRGYGRIKRVQFIGDGAEWIRNLWRQAFSDATLTLDFYHACGYLSVICKGIFAASEAAAGFKKLKLQLMRYGGAALMRYLPKKHAAGLATLDDKGEAAVNYLKTRVAFMNYAWLRREHYYIGSGSMESACKFLVAARCKQAGMHWRHKNAAYIAAIRAAIRSNRKLVA
jgi:hypothetical protein